MIISLSGYIGSGKDLCGSIIQFLTNTDKDCRKNFDGISIDTFEKWNSMRNEFPNWSGSSPWQIKKWAGPLRKVAAILLGMDEEFLYTDEFKQMKLPAQWGTLLEDWDGKDVIYETKSMTGREFLQKLGTDAIRNGLHENAWVNALMNGYVAKAQQSGTYTHNLDGTLRENPTHWASNFQWPNWIITDTRFPNELKAVKDCEGITIRINRASTEMLQLKSRHGHAMIGTLHASETSLDNAEFDYIVNNDGTIEELTEKLKLILIKEGLLK